MHARNQILFANFLKIFEKVPITLLPLLLLTEKIIALALLGLTRGK